jgi:hypothetical protein
MRLSKGGRPLASDGPLNAMAVRPAEAMREVNTRRA